MKKQNLLRSFGVFCVSCTSLIRPIIAACRYYGPYEIHEVLGKGVFHLRDGDNVLKQTANAANLKRYHDHISPSSNHGSPRPVPTPNTPVVKRVRKRTGTVSSSPSTPRTPAATSKAKPMTPTPSTVGVRRQILVVDSSPESSQTVVAKSWIPALNLNEDDKDLLLTEAWLNDKIIDACNTLVAHHMGDELCGLSRPAWYVDRDARSNRFCI